MRIYEGNNGAFNRKLANLPKKMDRAKDLALNRAGQDMRSKAVTLAPYKTGNLRRSITVDKRKDSVAVGTNVEYAAIHDKGGYIRAHAQRRTKLFGKTVEPFIVHMKRRYQRAYKGVGYLTPAFLIQKRYRFKQIMNEEVKHVLRSK